MVNVADASKDPMSVNTDLPVKIEIKE